MYFTYQYTIDSRDTDPFNQCRPSALLGLLQEAATEAAVALHVSREETLERYNRHGKDLAPGRQGGLHLPGL